MEAQEGGGVAFGIMPVKRESVIAGDLPAQGFTAISDLWLIHFDMSHALKQPPRGFLAHCRASSALPPGQAEEAGLAVASGGVARRHRLRSSLSSNKAGCSVLPTAISWSRRRCNSSRQRKRLPSISTNFGEAIISPSPPGASATLPCTPARRRDRVCKRSGCLRGEPAAGSAAIRSRAGGASKPAEGGALSPFYRLSVLAWVPHSD